MFFIQPAACLHPAGGRQVHPLRVARARRARLPPKPGSAIRISGGQHQDAAALDRRDVPGVDTALPLAVRLRLPSMASTLAAVGADPPNPFLRRRLRGFFIKTPSSATTASSSGDSIRLYDLATRPTSALSLIPWPPSPLLCRGTPSPSTTCR